MRVFILKAIILLAVLFPISSAWANGVEVDNVQRLNTPNRNRIAFQLSWQNSWNVSGTPSNHDAVWVFIKYRPCGSTGDWHHGLLSTTHNNHTLDPGLAFADSIRTVDRFGNPGANNTGALIRRASLGTGNIVSLPCTLQVVGGSGSVLFDDLVDYDIRVFAIEMVQIPQGVYALGDNGSVNYKYQTNSSNANPLIVTSEAAFTVYDQICGQDKNIPANFPKGFGMFYIMKYEISMGQYADFLNTLSGAVATQRFPGQHGQYRHRLTVAGGQYVSDRQDRACNFLNWNDMASYLDWAALRPITEMEYEKACKGNGPLAPLGYAWGSATYIEARNVTAPENGTEICTDADANLHIGGASQDILGGDSPTLNVPLTRGPIGCGIFARDATQTRETTGGSFYGVMELSGNVGEAVVTSLGSNGCSNAPVYSGLWGDGLLNGSGLFNVANWPAAPSGFGFGGVDVGWRGGCWETTDVYARVADRNYIYNGRFEMETRSRLTGGRGAR